MRYARVEGIGIISYWEFRRLTPGQRPCAPAGTPTTTPATPS